MNPIKITARCRTVTPMLSSGADQSKFEIRAAEVKAGLRFWWRAFQPFEKDSVLYEKESEIFGNTSKAAPFTVRVRYEDTQIPKWLTGSQHGWGPGLQYIFFAINSPESRKKGTPPMLKKAGDDGRPVAKPGGTYTLELLILHERRNIAPDLLCSLWLLENLGGLGGRTRRGAGCFEITALDIDGRSLEEVGARNDPASLSRQTPAFNFMPGQRPQDFLASGLGTVMDRWKTRSRTTPPSYTAVYYPTGIKDPSQEPDCSDVLILYDKPADSAPTAFQNAMEVMEAIGQCMKDYCLRCPFQEARDMHTALSTSRPLPATFVLTKAAKGLPIIYNFTEEFGKLRSGRLAKGYVATTVEVDGLGHPVRTSNGEYKEGAGRRASPLIISCHEKGGTPYAVLCHFPAPLIATEERLLLKATVSPRNPSLDRIMDAPGHTFVKDLIFRKRQTNGVCASLLEAFGKKARIRIK